MAEAISVRPVLPVGPHAANSPPKRPGLVAVPRSGRPLDDETRASFEPRLGLDLTSVRVHEGREAATTAWFLNARAYTVGEEVVFATGEYQPGTSDGKRLLAHELTHVKQLRQLGGASRLMRKPREDAPGVIELPPEFALAWQRQIGGIGGPLPAGEVREDQGLRVQQTDERHVRIDYANSQVEIEAEPNGRYSFYVDPAPVQPLPDPLAMLSAMEQPPRPVQRVVRVAANSPDQVRVFAPWTSPSGEVPELVVHTRYTGEGISTRPGLLGEVLERWTSQTSVQLSIDDTILQITTPQDDATLRAEDYPGARFAYSLDPEWSSSMGLEKRVFIVASPGVRVQTGSPSYAPLINYGRRLVPVVIRVSHPGLVPQQGTLIRPENFAGFKSVSEMPAFPGLSQQLTEEQQSRILTEARGFAGVTITHPWSGSQVSLRPENPSIGAAFAWQVVPPTNESYGEIRVVAGPGTVIEFAEPIPRRLRDPNYPVATPRRDQARTGEGLEEERVRLWIVEVPENGLVPMPGTPLNVDYYLAHGWLREPDQHRWLGANELGYAISTAAADVVFRSIPIVGDLINIGEFVAALFTDRDIWGREVTAGDKVLMGFGVVIGLIPFLSEVSPLIRSGSRMAKTARELGKTTEELEAIVSTAARSVTAEEAETVSRAARALEVGGEIAEEDLPAVERAVSRVAPGVWLRPVGGIGLELGERGLITLGERAEMPLENARLAEQIAKWLGEEGELSPAVELALERSGAVSSAEEASAAMKQALRDAARDPASGIDAARAEALAEALPGAVGEGAFARVEPQPGWSGPVSFSGRMKQPRALRVPKPEVTYGRVAAEFHRLEPSQAVARRIEKSERALGRAFESVGESAVERGKAFAASEHGVTVSGYKPILERTVDVTPEEVARHSEEIGHRLSRNPADTVAGEGFPGRFSASHAEKKQILAHPNQPVGVNRPMCPDCMRFFVEEAHFQGQSQVVSDTLRTRVFSPDGTITEYWRDGTRMRVEPDGRVLVSPAARP